jgi:pSer/pThr/pTyr-binding forkhead associated (FHA) protein
MYNEPAWAQKPSQEWSLLEIKSGVECSTYELQTRKCTILGRAEDMVHIALAHESCSRQHGRIAFDSQGIPWLRDLQSTHGTTCNKRQLPKQAIGKIESMSTTSGARGVMLFPGDVLQFGASSRLFCVQGPEEYERGAVKAKMQQQHQAATEKQLMQQPEDSSDDESKKEKDTGVSWGMSMNDDVGDDQVSASEDKTLPMELQVPEKHRKAFDRLNALKYKMANLETEDSRIRRKGELSEGQEKQLQRNQER